jgi:hypothetical protein
MIIQVTAEDVERSSTLEDTDVGRWAIIHLGCWFLFDTREEAQRTWVEVSRG